MTLVDTTKKEQKRTKKKTTKNNFLFQNKNKFCFENLKGRTNNLSLNDGNRETRSQGYELRECSRSSSRFISGVKFTNIFRSAFAKIFF